MEYFVSALREHQELAIFLTLAVGFLIGQTTPSSSTFPSKFWTPS